VLLRAVDYQLRAEGGDGVQPEEPSQRAPRKPSGSILLKGFRGPLGSANAGTAEPRRAPCPRSLLVAVLLAANVPGTAPRASASAGTRCAQTPAVPALPHGLSLCHEGWG
jgi:hypothetical protein